MGGAQVVQEIPRRFVFLKIAIDLRVAADIKDDEETEGSMSIASRSSGNIWDEAR